MIVVISNCQTYGLASAVSSLMPDQEVRSFHVNQPDQFSREEVVELVRQADACLSLPLGTEWGEMEISNLETCGKVRRFPSFIFTGFHPDAILSWRSGGGYVPSPMVYHSLIAAGAYCAGYRLEEVIDLFCAKTYATFGYTEAFSQSKRAITDVWTTAGFDISQLLAKWQEKGIFCYCFNHPKATVINDLAHLVLSEMGLGVRSSEEIENEIPDYLAMGPNWPLYPELAEPLGLVGSTVFKTATTGYRTHLMPLERFLTECFAGYDEAQAKDDLLLQMKVIKASEFFLAQREG